MVTDAKGCACIHLASQVGHTAIVAYRRAKGVPVNCQDSTGMTPLMWSSYKVSRLMLKMFLFCVVNKNKNICYI